jgi:hypothetical protein
VTDVTFTTEAWTEFELTLRKALKPKPITKYDRADLASPQGHGDRAQQPDRRRELMGTHEQSVGATDEWFTPPYIFDALGEIFDLDVAHPGAHVVDWVPAKQLITHDSLKVDWHGFIWMNAPFGPRNGMVPWLEKFVTHGDGIALTPDRTSAPWWNHFAPLMDAVLFVSPKVKFIGRDGRPGCSPAQGTSLMAIGDRGVAALMRAERLGPVFVPRPRR